MKVNELRNALSGFEGDAEVYVLGYENGGDVDFCTELRSFLYDGETLELRGPVIKEYL